MSMFSLKDDDCNELFITQSSSNTCNLDKFDNAVGANWVQVSAGSSLLMSQYEDISE